MDSDQKPLTKQEMIIQINRDTTLTNDEKRQRINDIMLGKYKDPTKILLPSCTHYKKMCNKFHFNCCDKIYDCCRCHNQANLCNKTIFVDNICCDKCGFEQTPSSNCSNCGIQFSRSFCEICNIWSEKDIYHCNKCGLCRVGKADKYFHCDNCESCFKLPKNDENIHICITPLSKTTQCLLCLESAATTSQYHLMAIKCAHVVHHECLISSLKNGNYKCPLCRKSMIDMTQNWNILDQEILLNQLPEEIKKKVNITCFDCSHKSSDVDWHFIGLKCKSCGSYNTSCN